MESVSFKIRIKCRLVPDSVIITTRFRSHNIFIFYIIFDFVLDVKYSNPTENGGGTAKKRGSYETNTGFTSSG